MWKQLDPPPKFVPEFHMHMLFAMESKAVSITPQKTERGVINGQGLQGDKENYLL